MNQQTAIVTGASRGIGAAIARRLAAEGYAVVVNYAGSAAEAGQLVASIVEQGGTAAAIRADVADSAAVVALFEETIARFGRVDVLVNNAGIMPPSLPRLSETDDATFDRLMAVNVKGTFNTLREAARRMRQGARIVNLSTSVTGLGRPGYAVYGATKAAVEVMTNVLSKELRGRDIVVNAVAPGPTATELFLNGKTEEQVDAIAKLAPLERIGRPEEIAEVVAFLARPGIWVNGQTLRANGGMV
ncbi:SDR family oxidoreductase [Massilia endophytica]|uniref:SDR family oxidoreductase n=1 Tax=Massilia endophytica TaxID=2899220 RepID=UPI001E64F1ED|nr:SDR family oxidoreductase [Massilia endophytica]UGQ47598.1 SDR family oxidoreductase [Massilia endophytica]